MGCDRGGAFYAHAWNDARDSFVCPIEPERIRRFVAILMVISMTSTMTTPHKTLGEEKSGQQIDLVYTWCDGADPEFQNRKAKRLKDFGLQLAEDNSGAVRYANHDELRYSLRSVQKYLPWVRKIYIVTDKQRPSWFVEHEKIHFVDHTEIIPQELLPTFSSVTIEMYLSRIPGLAEKFIYLNDDIFINRPMNPSDFFSEGQPIVRFTKKKRQRITLSEAQAILSASENDDFETTVIRSWYTFCTKNQKTVHYEGLVHSADSYTKTLFDEVLKKYPEAVASNISPFRTGKEYQRILFLYEMAYVRGCPIQRNRSSNFWGRLISYFVALPCFSITRQSLGTLQS